jgi:cupin fold WbuC family metalloprotein
MQLLDSSLFAALIERARQSPRLRTNHNFHSSMEDNPHRFLNVMIRGTSIAPHRHRDPPKSESFIVLKGVLAFFTFDDAGQVTGTHSWGDTHVASISCRCLGPGFTSKQTTCSDSTAMVCQYSAATDNDFAPRGLPREGESAAGAYLHRLVGRLSAGC